MRLMRLAFAAGLPDVEDYARSLVAKNWIFGQSFSIRCRYQVLCAR
jgi:hypothetical protein